MRLLTHTIARREVMIRVVETADDVNTFIEWCYDRLNAPTAFDLETTGLDVWSPGFEIRLAQFGNEDEAWVLDYAKWHEAVDVAFLSMNELVIHNASFDLIAMEAVAGYSAADAMKRVTDTRILSHLIDPRGQADGGIGHGLKNLSEVWVDSAATEGEEQLATRFKELGATKSTGWSVISPDDVVLQRYAGLDVILTARVFDVFEGLITEANLEHLAKFEHDLACSLIGMQARGIKLDVGYTSELLAKFSVEYDEAVKKASRYGVTSINSTAQVAEALTAMGEELTETTSSGRPKVDRAVLMPLADLDRDWKRIGEREPNPLASAVLYGKRASKWSSSYAQAFLDLKDQNDRIHPSINGLQARTARMSISNPPLQQLPSSDSTIRSAFIADPGNVLIAADYSQIEMRVLAALSNDQTMISAIKSGVDLHDFTAQKLFGDDFTPKQRKLAKGVGFGKCYGGGAQTLSRQTGADIDAVKHAIAAYDETFPGVKRLANKLQRDAEFGRKEVQTPSGRVLPLDRDRLYSATNYLVQSTARDILAQAIIRLTEEGLGGYMLLPIHDEILAQAPVDEAEDVLRQIRKVMERDAFMGVPLVADGEVVGSNWGEAYV